MQKIPHKIEIAYKAMLRQKNIPQKNMPYYMNWVRYYLDFCHKYRFIPEEPKSLPDFQKKLKAKRQSSYQIRQASHAVSLFGEMNGMEKPNKDTIIQNNRNISPKKTPLKPPSDHTEKKIIPATKSSVQPTSYFRGQPAIKGYLRKKKRYQVADKKSDFENSESVPTPQLMKIPDGKKKEYLKQTGADWQLLYQEFESAIKVRHYSPKTLKSYGGWIRHFQAFLKSKDYRLIDMIDVKEFLSFLAVKRKVSASSQNQAFNALLFLFRHVFGREFGKVEGVVRAKRKPYIPAVLTREEVDKIIGHLAYPYDLVAKLLYGCGLRLSECLNLRVHNIVDPKSRTIFP